MTEEEQRKLGADIAYAPGYSLEGKPLPKGQRWLEAQITPGRSWSTSCGQTG